MSHAEMSVPLLTRLGNYELLRLLAQGGMADIYLARDNARYVAVKVLNQQRAADPEAGALFRDEARLCAMLGHPNLAVVHEVAAEGGVRYLAMEYVHGADLREVLAATNEAVRAIPYETALSIVTAAAAGLDHAHRRCSPDGRPLHLVHRDVSLSNIMVTHDGEVKVIDFGIARASVSLHRTNPGVVRGKASYMSPEQCLGEPVDLRTDVYALGVVLYELTTGRRCFVGNSDFERMLAVVRGDYVAPSAIVPEFPADLERVIQTALAIDPAHRFASAAALIEALEQIARANGWLGGPSTIAGLMRELYGEVAPPDFHDDTDAEVQLPAPQPTVAMTRPRRFPRGTESDVRGELAPEHEDLPTRGRRSMPRLWPQSSAA